MLTRIRNANTANHQTVDIPLPSEALRSPRFCEEEGFIRDFEFLADEGPQGTIRIALKYGPEREKVITGLRRISRPGCASTRSKPKFRACWAASAWSSSPRRRASCRASAPSAKASAVKSSRTSGKSELCHASVSSRSPSPAASTSTSADSVVHVKGPKGELAQHILPARRRQDRRRFGSRSSATATPSRHARRTASRARSIANMVEGVTEGLPQEPGDSGRRLSRRQGRRRPQPAAWATRIPVVFDRADGHLRSSLEGTNKIHVDGHRQAAGRPSRRRDSRSASAGALQGQRHSLRRRSRAQEAR